jgi:uncharacterized protein
MSGTVLAIQQNIFVSTRLAFLFHIRMISGESKTNCPPGPQRVSRKRMIIIPAILGGIYLATMAGVGLNQRHLIYFPDKAPLSTLLENAIDQNLQCWTNSSNAHIGWKRLNRTTVTNAPQFLVLHGNAGQAFYWVDFANTFQKIAPCDVYLLEYPGFGARAGKPTEKTIYAAAREALSLLDPNRKIFIVGESLGTGVAAYLAGVSGKDKLPPVAGVLLLGPYNNMASVGQSHMWIFPVHLILRDRYPADKHLQTYSGPVGFLIGGRDQVIPSKFGRKLYESYHGPKRLWEDPAATHDQLHRRDLDWWKEALKFLETKQ